jgi:hypothetical protein
MGMNRPAKPKNAQEWVCSFCGKSQTDVALLIAGPSVFICNDSFEVCQNIIADTKQEAFERELPPPEPLPHGDEIGSPISCTLCGTSTPRGDLFAILNRGLLCVGCIGEIEAAVAARRQSAL